MTGKYQLLSKLVKCDFLQNPYFNDGAISQNIKFHNTLIPWSQKNPVSPNVSISRCGFFSWNILICIEKYIFFVPKFQDWHSGIRIWKTPSIRKTGPPQSKTQTSCWNRLLPGIYLWKSLHANWLQENHRSSHG